MVHLGCLGWTTGMSAKSQGATEDCAGRTGQFLEQPLETGKAQYSEVE